MDSGHRFLLGNSTPVTCVNLETSLLTINHRGLTLCVCFHQGLNKKQKTCLKQGLSEESLFVMRVLPKGEGGNHGDGAVTLSQQQLWCYQLQVAGTKGGSCHCKLEGRARQQWPSAERPSQLEVTLPTRIQGNPYLQQQLSSLPFLCGVLYWPNPPEARGTGTWKWFVQLSLLGLRAGWRSIWSTWGYLEGQMWVIRHNTALSNGQSSHNFGVHSKKSIQKYLTLANKKNPKAINRRLWKRPVLKLHYCSFIVNLPLPMALVILT